MPITLLLRRRKVLAHQAFRGNGEPAVMKELAQHRLADQLELDQDGREAVEVGNREDGPGVLCQDRFLVGKARSTDCQDRPDWRSLVAEALDVGLAERALPSERLLADEPGAMPEAFTLAD